MKLIRVFPRQTNATPTDSLAIVNSPPGLFDEADRVHVSVTFSWDIPRAEQLAKQWACVAPVKIGGPAIGTLGGEFEPGLYLKQGYVITSRGCPNRCWFCQAWRRDGNTRELQIKDGWNILDDNLLACSRNHIQKVFAMLRRQKHPPKFSGGLEAARLKSWHVDLLRKSRANPLFFAYDSPNDLEPLRAAGALLRKGGVPKSILYCYVLCGYPKDTLGAAERRMKEAWSAGFMPFAMLYQSAERGSKHSAEWQHFQRLFARPAATRSILTGKERPKPEPDSQDIGLD